MIKISVGKVTESFDTEIEAMQYLADMAGDKSLRFRRTEYAKSGDILSMEFLTYYQGQVKETYSTSR